MQKCIVILFYSISVAGVLYSRYFKICPLKIYLHAWYVEFGIE